MAEGRIDEARREFEIEPSEVGKQAGLAMVYHALVRQADSATALDKLIRDHGEDSAFGVAEVYGYLGGADNAFEWLERAYRQKDPRTE